MPDESELDRLDPQPVLCKMSTGFQLEIVRMRTRQFFRLLRVLTHGAGPALTQAGLDFSADAAEFGSKLLVLVVMSIPDAESEAVQFLSSMCRPAGVVEKPASQLTKQETEANQALWAQFAEELHNPELTDTLDLIEIIIIQEAPELQALGKKLQTVLALFRKTGQDKEPPEPELPVQDLNSPARSHRRSTRSATSTGGPTSTSSTSPSADSGRPSRPSGPDASATTSPD
jgi:hypothetical protein